MNAIMRHFGTRSGSNATNAGHFMKCIHPIHAGIQFRDSFPKTGKNYSKDHPWLREGPLYKPLHLTWSELLLKVVTVPDHPSVVQVIVELTF